MSKCCSSQTIKDTNDGLFRLSFLQNLTSNYLSIPSNELPNNLGDGIAYCGSNIGPLFSEIKTLPVSGSGKYIEDVKTLTSSKEAEAIKNTNVSVSTSTAVVGPAWQLNTSFEGGVDLLNNVNVNKNQTTMFV